MGIVQTEILALHRIFDTSRRKNLAHLRSTAQTRPALRHRIRIHLRFVAPRFKRNALFDIHLIQAPRRTAAAIVIARRIQPRALFARRRLLGIFLSLGFRSATVQSDNRCGSRCRSSPFHEIAPSQRRIHVPPPSLSQTFVSDYVSSCSNYPMCLIYLGQFIDLHSIHILFIYQCSFAILLSFIFHINYHSFRICTMIV